MLLLSIKNISTKEVSTPLGLIAPGATYPSTGLGAQVTRDFLEKSGNDLDFLKNGGYITYTVQIDPAASDPAQTYTYSQLGLFISGLETGTGAVQNIPHTLGVVPTKVLVTVYTAGAAFSVVEGTHTATNLVVTVTIGDTYKVMAIV